VTTEGKRAVSQNATRHGLSGENFRVLPDECQADFDRLLASFLRAESPADDIEAEFVRQMAEAMWLSRRSVRLQETCFAALQSGDAEAQRAAQKNLALYLRYQSAHDRAFSRYSTELRKHRNERRRADRGFVSQKFREAAEERRKASFAIRQAIEKRKQERHELRTQIEKAKLERLQPQPSAAKCLAAAA
jgi:hypothetical protein